MARVLSLLCVFVGMIAVCLCGELQSGKVPAGARRFHKQTTQSIKPSDIHKRSEKDNIFDPIAPAFAFLHYSGHSEVVEQLESYDPYYKQEAMALMQETEMVDYLNTVSSAMHAFHAENDKKRSVRSDCPAFFDEIHNRDAPLYRSPFGEVEDLVNSGIFDYARSGCGCSGSLGDPSYYANGGDVPGITNIGDWEYTVEACTYADTIAATLCEAALKHPIPTNIGLCIPAAVTGVLKATAELTLTIMQSCLQAKKEQVARAHFELNTIVTNHLKAARKTEIERILASKSIVSSFFIPQAQGGALEDLRDVVKDVYSNYKSANRVTGGAITLIDSYLSNGDSGLASGNSAGWATAFFAYRRAYWNIVQLV